MRGSAEQVIDSRGVYADRRFLLALGSEKVSIARANAERFLWSLPDRPLVGAQFGERFLVTHERINAGDEEQRAGHDAAAHREPQRVVAARVVLLVEQHHLYPAG